MSIPQRRHPRLSTSTMALVLALLAAGVLLSVASTARAAASWQFVPVAAPPPPPGVTASTTPVPLGPVGQISFWAPNRGLLITGGTEDVTGVSSGTGVVAAGVWAYNGAVWHELSTVCGGAYGRIAWAGPDEFWTISDQRPGQVVAGPQPNLQSISLCHFDDGQVVASYAMPVDEPDSYMPMDAAACNGPDDCWFGGYDDDTGHAFQLHWDGTDLYENDEPEDHSVDDMLDYQGQIYESVRFSPDDGYLPTEDPAAPAVLHKIEGTSFDDVYTYGEGRQLPDGGSGIAPDDIEGFALSTDGGALGQDATQLWAAADPSPLQTPSGPLTILHQTQAGWTQVAPALPQSAAPSCASGPAISAAASPFTSITDDDNVPDSLDDNAPEGTSNGSIAAMPGTDEAWLSIPDETSPITPYAEPELVLIDARGCVDAVDMPTDSASDQQTETTYPTVFASAFAQAPGQSSAPGLAGPIDCPAADDCWMADSDGWLYQYNPQDTQYPVDTDPNFAGVITVRPPDGATVTVYGDVAPPDDSGVGTTTAPPTGTPRTIIERRRGVTVRLTHVTAKLVHRTELKLSFDLNTRALIQIVGERRGKVVARSARRVLDAGRRTLVLTLDPRRWPNHLTVDASPETSR